MTHLVFVYGTLKKGFPNHHYFMQDAKFICNDTISAKMYNYGNFPAVVLDEDSVVSGEVYEVNDATLRDLDRLEGVPRFYNRDFTVPHKSPMGEEVHVFVYVMTPEQTKGLPEIKSGEWTKGQLDV